MSIRRDNPKHLRTVRLLNPLACTWCSSVRLASVMLRDGTVKQMFYCPKRDCDNWITEPKEDNRNG
jgi:hypothetical protein